MAYKDKKKAAEYNRTYQRNNPEKVKLKILKYRYGISGVNFQEMTMRQDGKCAICKRSLPLNLDHNHDTGQLRELLCRGCNWGIWSFGEDEKG